MPSEIPTLDHTKNKYKQALIDMVNEIDAELDRLDKGAKGANSAKIFSMLPNLIQLSGAFKVSAALNRFTTNQ